MRKSIYLAGVLVIIFGVALTAAAQVRVVSDHNSNSSATPTFKFKQVPPPVKDDAATNAKLLLVDGELDGNGAELSALTDGALPTEEDEPAKNLFFNAGTGGGRVRMDLGGVMDIAQINTYSWHPNTRGPQLYRVWASDGTGPKFSAEPRADIDPVTCGWKLITIVDTRPKTPQDEEGGQYATSITDASGSLGKYRYLLFGFFVVETADDYGNTFYSEIDVVRK